MFSEMHSFLSMLDPNNQLVARDWIALFAFLFAITSFILTQAITSRYQRTTRQLAVRPNFQITGITRNIKLTTEAKGVEKGFLITNKEYKDLVDIKKEGRKINDTIINNVRYIQVKNLGPSYALDVKFEFKCKNKDNTNHWKIEATKQVMDEDEYVYIPINNVDDYPDVIRTETKVTFKTQSNETIVIIMKKNKKTNRTTYNIYKKLLWGLYNKKITGMSKDRFEKGLIVE
jgi:hypothetical protein